MRKRGLKRSGKLVGVKAAINLAKKLEGVDLFISRELNKTHKAIYRLEHENGLKIFGKCSKCKQTIVPKHRNHAIFLVYNKKEGKTSLCWGCAVNKGKRVYAAKKSIFAKRGIDIKKQRIVPEIDSVQRAAILPKLVLKIEVKDE